MDIALVKPPRHRSSSFKENSESLALGYLATALRKAGHKVTILNAALRDIGLNDIAKQVHAHSYDLFGLSIPDPTLVEPTFSVVRQIRKEGYAGHISVGGHTATFHWRDILGQCPEIDSVVLFEGEETICELSDALEQGGQWRSIRGLAFRNNDEPVKNADRRLIDDLDRLPFPARDDLEYVLANHNTATVPILTSRGCHFNCSFCSVRSFYKSNGRPSWRRRSVRNVLDEIENIHSRFGVVDFLFVDDLFLDRSPGAQKYAEDFAEAILNRGMSITFTVSTTVDAVVPEVFLLLRKAGLRRVFIGAESASPEILRYLNKWFEPEHIRRALGILTELEIEACVSWINFTPFSKIHHLRENLSFFSELGIDLLPGLLNRYQVYAGTPLFHQLKEDGALKGKFPHYDYIGVDPKGELAYEVSRATFKPFLTIAEELKRITRQLRPMSFPSPTQSNYYWTKLYYQDDPTQFLDNKTALSLIRKGINNDTAYFFGRMLDLVELQDDSCTMDDIASSIDDCRSQVISCCEGWLKTLRYFDLFCIDQRFTSRSPSKCQQNSGQFNS